MQGGAAMGKRILFCTESESSEFEEAKVLILKSK